MSEVNIPITLTVEGIKTGAVDFGKLEKDITGKMSGIVKTINHGLDASKFNKSLTRSMDGVVNAYDKYARAKVAFEKAQESAMQTSPAYKAEKARLEDIIKSAQDSMAEVQRTLGGPGSFFAASGQLDKLLQPLRDDIANAERDLKNLTPDKFVDSISESGLNAISAAYSKLIRAMTSATDANRNWQTSLEENKYTDGYAQRIKDMAEAQKKLQALRDKTEKNGQNMSTSQWTSAVKEAEELKTKIQDIAHEMELMVRMGDAFRFGSGNKRAELENIAAALQSAGEGVEGVREGANSSAAAFNMIGNAAKSAAGRAKSAIKSIISSLTGLIKKLHVAHKNTNSMGKGLKHLWRNFMMFGLGFRSLYFMVKRLRTAAIAAIKEMAKAIPEVNASVSSIMTSMNKFKGSFATAFEPLLQPLANILARIAELANVAANAIARLFAQLRGRNYIYQFTAAQEDYAASADNATKSTDKEIHSLMRFDEINRLDGNNDSGSGSSDSSIGTWASTPFEPSAFVKMMQDAWAKVDFTEVGKTIATGLAAAFNLAADWLDGTYGPFLKKVATSLATFINGFTSEGTGLPKAFGRMIGSAINNSLTGLNTFLTTVNFAQVGKFIADCIMEGIRAIDWNLAAETLGNGLVGMITLAWSFLTNINFDEIGQKLTGAINTLLDTMGTADDSGLTGWQKLGQSISSAFTGLTTIIIDVLKGLDWQEIGQSVGEFIASIDWAKVFSDLGTIVWEFIKGLAAAFSSWVDTDPLSAAIVGVIASVIAMLDVAGIFLPLIGNISKVFEFIGTFGSIIAKVTGWGLAIAGFITSIMAFFDQLKNGFSVVKSIIMEVGAVLGAIGLVIAGVCSWWAVLIAGVVAALAAAFLWARDNWSEICAWFANTLSVIKETWTAAWEAIKQWFVTVWSTIKTFFIQVWGTVCTALSTALNAIKTAWSNTMNGIKTFTINLWNSIVGGIKTAVNAIIGVVNKMVSGVASGINAVINAMNMVSVDIPDWVPALGGSHFGINIPNVTAPQIPYLAQGAVIPPNNQFMAMLGDQKHGTNVEAPLATIQEAVAVVIDDYLDGMMAGFDAVVQAINNKDLAVAIGDTEIGKAAARYNRRQSIVKGMV